MVFKIVGSLLVLCSSTYIGFKFANSYMKRVKELDGLTSLMVELKNHIEYTHTSLPEAFLKVSLNAKKPYSDIFNEISECLYKNKVDRVYDAFKIAFNKEKYNMNLKDKDIEILMEFSKTLGSWDVEGHKNVFDLATNKLKKRVIEAEEAANKNVKMYKYLGFSIGAMIVIVLI